MIRQIAHIIVPPREKRSATFRVFTAETTPEEEAARGLLFACFVIDYYHHRNEEILDSITEELQSRYYDPDITTQQPENLFEETLQLLNTTLAQLIENEQIFLNLKRFHAVIGVIRGKTLTFTINILLTSSPQRTTLRRQGRLLSPVSSRTWSPGAYAQVTQSCSQQTVFLITAQKNGCKKLLLHCLRLVP